MKTKSIFFLLNLLIGCLLFSSCSEEAENEIRSFEIAESELIQNFTQNKSFVMIPVNTTLASSEWSIGLGADWCKGAQSYNNSTKIILLEVSENGDPETRTTTLEIKSPIKNYTITVNQLGYGKSILVKDIEAIPVTGGQIDIEVTANVEYNVVFSKECDWLQPLEETRGMAKHIHSFTASTNNSYEERLVEIAFICKEDPEVKAISTISQKGKPTSTDDVVAGEVQIRPTGVTANQAQPGYTADKCIDGNFDTHYHSPYGGATVFPVDLEFTFDGTQDIDYLTYFPRNGNGNFGELDVYTATKENPEYNLFKSLNFEMKASPSRVNFTTPLSKVTKIKFSVKSGAGGLYASCAEMQFFRKDNSLEAQLQTVFTDATCSELIPNITSEAIDALPSYFAGIGFQLKNNTYDEREKKFRIHDYEPYSNVEAWANKLMTKRYSELDNPTGIYAEAGKSIVVLVGNTHGQTVSLQAITDKEAQGDVYPLAEGVNKINIRRTGMLFLMYTADLSDPNAKPIRVHIPPQSGHVDGFFDLKEDKTNEAYAALISKANYKYFCVKGEKIILYLYTSAFRQVVPNTILPTINLWDNVVDWQQELMGINDIRPSEVNNHIFAISLDPNDDGYMWASDYRIAFNYKTLDRLLDYNKMMENKNNIWGPAHEVGHIHQSAINWPICSEASNNLFSNFSLFKLGEVCTRGKELSVLATQHCVQNDSWVDLDNELKIRMYWQLWNYFHRCGYMTDFWQKVFKELRQDRLPQVDPGASQMKFVRKVCEVANMNLFDYFNTWGFFTPIDREIEQYGKFRYTVTTGMINETKTAIAKYPNPKHAFQYLEDRKQSEITGNNYKVGDVGHYSAFKDNQKINKKITYTKAGNTIMIQNGEEAVCFEIKKGNTLLFFSNFFSFDLPVPASLEETAHVYAVQADGERILVTPK